jgi:hypothetical protein
VPIRELTNPAPYLPEDTVEIRYPFKLKRTKCPVNKTNVASWTEAEREKAVLADSFVEMEDLADYVSKLSRIGVAILISGTD